MTQLQGTRVAVVTGAARNIGRAIALGLARDGARVMVNAVRSRDEAAEVVGAIEAAGGEAALHLADVSDPDGAQSLIDATVSRFGRLDILVNNAAIRRETRIEDLDWREWRDVLGVILDGAYLCTKAALPHLRRSDAGTVVAIGGMSAHGGSSGRAHVTAAKLGLVGLVHGLAHDLGPDGITVNCVVPGLIDTVRGASAAGTPQHHGHKSTLLGRRGSSEEVAAAVRYLCGPDARYVTGQTLHINGGAYLG